MSSPDLPEPLPPARSDPESGTAAESDPAAPASSRSPTRAVPVGFSRYRWMLGLAVCLLLLGIVFLPRLISRRWVYQPMLERMRTGALSFRVDSVDLYWLKPIQLHGVTITESMPQAGTGEIRVNRPPLLQVQQIGTDRGLLAYLFSGRELGRLEISEPTIDFELLQDDGSFGNFLRALGGNADRFRPHADRKPSPASVAVSIHDARIVVRQAGLEAPLLIVQPFDLAVAYQANEQEAWLRIEPTTLLDRVALTPELLQLGLEFVVPILARAAWLSGEVSVTLGEIEIPLARPVEAVGTAAVTFHSVRAGLSEPALEAALRRVAALLGRESTNELVLTDHNVVQVVMADSVVHHETLKIGLPRVDPRLQITTAGDVSLADRSLDLVLSIPIPLDLLARNDAVRELGVPMVRLPVQGVIGRPELQWAQLRGDSADVLSAISGQLAEDAPLSAAVIDALGGVAGGEADQAIGAAAQALLELRQRLQQRRQSNQGDPEADGSIASDKPLPPGAAESDADQQTTPDRRRSLLDRLRTRLRGSEESQ